MQSARYNVEEAVGIRRIGQNTRRAIWDGEGKTNAKCEPAFLLTLSYQRAMSQVSVGSSPTYVASGGCWARQIGAARFTDDQVWRQINAARGQGGFCQALQHGAKGNDGKVATGLVNRGERR